MFDRGVALFARDIESLADALRLLDDEAGDVERVDQLAALERLKSSAAAAQARVTAAFVDSQEQVAEAWRARAAECSAAGDFEGWRAAREQARRASLPSEAAERAEPFEPGAARRVSARGPRGGRGWRGANAATHGVAAQVALARRVSPAQGSRHVTVALTVTQQMPGTLAALEAGRLSEWRAGIIVRESAGLDQEQRAVLDGLISAELSSDAGALSTSGDRELARRVRAIAYRLDPHTVVERSARAEHERRVTLRPAPDTMAYLTALLPVAQAVATQAALTSAADTARAAGDPRGKGQVMADTLVARVTGQQSAPAVPVEVQLVISDRSLLGDGHEAAHLAGYGAVPAGWASQLLHPDHDPAPDRGPKSTPGGSRGSLSDPASEPTPDTPLDPSRRTRPDLAPATPPDSTACGSCGSLPDPARESAPDSTPCGSCGSLPDPAADSAPDPARGPARAGAGESRARVWLRRLYTDPTGRDLVAMESTRRVFDGGLRRFILTRDAGACLTPWCDAPARHIDHIHPYADGGPTTASNGQALCIRCNHTKQEPGWSATVARAPSGQPEQPGQPRQLGQPHAQHVITTTPTGHQYPATSPPLLPGHPPDRPARATARAAPGQALRPAAPPTPASPGDEFAVPVRALVTDPVVHKKVTTR